MIHSASLVHATEKGDELISYMARVSNPANQDKPWFKPEASLL